MPQALGLADDLVNTRQLLPCLGGLDGALQLRGKHRIPMAGDRGGDASDTEQCQAGTEEVPLAGVSMLMAQALVVHDSIARSCRHRGQGSSAECVVGAAEKQLIL